MDWVRPRALRPGDRVGVVAPAGPVDADRLARGVAELRRLGFEPVVSDGALERRGFTAGPPERRLHELYAAFEDDDLAGVFCARGGAGLVQLLPELLPERLLQHPKALLGYSDLTFLHAVLNSRGLVTFHGPMVAREIGDGAYHRESLLLALFGQGVYRTEEDELLPLRAGAAEGRLLGGCLSILAAACGTPWSLRAAEDVILLIEDVDEAPYKVDRMLRQLRAAGLFEHVRGMVLGDFPGCSPALEASYTLQDVVLEALAGLEVPIALGLSTGHTPNPGLTLPLGARARLECDLERAAFRILEPAVC